MQDTEFYELADIRWRPRPYPRRYPRPRPVPRDMVRIRLTPEDRVLAFYPDPVSEQGAARVKGIISDRLGIAEDHILVLGGGVRLQVWGTA